MKFRAVWEDSSEASEEEVEDNSLLDIIPRRVDKGKQRRVTVEDDEGSFEDGQTIEDEEDEEQSPETTPMRERRSARALIPTDHGDYVHPYEAEASNTRHTTPTRAVSISGMDVEQATPPPVPWPAQLGIEPHRVHVMQQSFFHTQNTRPQKTVEPQQQPASFLLAAGRKRTREPSVQMIDAQERADFSSNALATLSRPVRKFVRVPEDASLTDGKEGYYRDLGLSMGRSFRVGWGPGGTIAHIGSLCGVNQNSDYESPTVITVERIRMSSHKDEEEQERSNDLLATLSNHTVIVSDFGVPFASISTGFRFHHLVELFHISDHSHEAELWRLCSSLFDEFDVDISFLEENIRRPIEQNRRKDSLSDWLENCVKSRVESDLRLIPHGIENAGKRLFALMTGNQIERACEEALDAKYLHLATLLAQTPDEGFREDILAQLEIWKDERVEEVLEPDVLKIYQILGGHLVKEGVNGHELDWRRLFGLRLWYGKMACDVDGLQGTLDEFEELLSQGKISAPIPWWLEGSGRDPSSSSQYHGLLDAHFVIMRLAALQTETLDSLLRSLSFSPAPLDTKLPFFLSLVLGRSLKTRDFSDRERLRGALPNVYGASHMAGSLIASYAAMLENVGCVKEAAFVLLFLEAAAGRKKAIVELLSRHAHRLEGSFEEEILKLQIPPEWIHEAKTIWLLYQGEIFEGYESALKAGLYSLAHNLAVNELAPEVGLKGDMRLLRHIFARIDPRSVVGWSARGKLYLDYANLIILLDQQERDRRVGERSAYPDAVQAAELARLTLELPKLIPLMPLIGGQNPALIHRAVVQQMATELLKRQTQLESLGLNSDAITLRKSGLTVDEGSRANYVKAKAYQLFAQAVQTAV